MPYASRRHKEQVFRVLAEAVDCGPFDGGCLVFAEALKSIYGGEIYVIAGVTGDTGGSPIAQHAVLRMPDGQYADGDGIGWRDVVVNRFVANECLGGLTRQDVRAFQVGDLPDCPRDVGLVKALAHALLNPLASLPKPR